MKAVTLVITMMLILSITIIMAVLLWLFMTGSFNTLTSSGSSTMNQTLVTVTSCMKIESVSGNKVFLRNCGKGSITQNTLKVYLNGVAMNITSFSGPSETFKTFGKTDVGSSSTNAYFGDTHVVRFYLPEAGLITKITAYVSGAYGSATIHAGLYNDSSDNPNNLKGTTGNIIVPTTLGWYDFIFSTPLSLPAGTYHIGLYSTNDFVWNYDAGSSSQYHYDVWSDFPNQWSGGSTRNREMSIYATYKLNNTINEDEVGIVDLEDLWGIPQGRYLLKVTNPKVIAEKEVEVILPDSTVLALDFDESSGTTAYDKSRYNNNGILHNGTEICSNGYCPKWVNGKFDYGLLLDGLGDYIDCGNSNSLDLEKFTIGLWLKLNKINDYQFLVEKGNNDYDNYGFHLCSPGDELALEYRSNMEHYHNVTDNAHLQINEWYHIAVSFDDSRVVYYKDGVEILTNYTTLYPDFNTDNLFIGMQRVINPTRKDFLNATIDSVRIYNEAITPNEMIGLRLVNYD